MRPTIPIGGKVHIGPKAPLAVIAGPCVLENLDAALALGASLKDICRDLALPLIFKGSFDKANRTSIESPRGPGLEAGLDILTMVRAKLDLPILTDIHLPRQAERVASVVDILQVPAFLCRQTDLLIAAGKAGKPVNIKKGQFLAPRDMIHCAAKVASTGNDRILLTERGTVFGYHRLVNDMAALPLMAEIGYPVIFDVTHSTQRPSAAGSTSSGDPHLAPYLARAAAAVGTDALYLEVHPEPSHSPSDAESVLDLEIFAEILRQVKEIDRLGHRL